MDCRLLVLFILVLVLPAVGNAEDGAELYHSLCASCHGADGAGDGPGVPATAIRPRPFSAAAFKFDTDADWQRGTDDDIANVIKNGTRAYGGSPLMPPWSDLSDDEVTSLITQIRSFVR